MQAGAVGLAGETRGVEEFFGLRGVVIVVARGGVVGPMIGREKAVGFAGFIVEKEFDEGIAVGGEGEGLADFALGEDGVFHVDAEIVKVGAGALGDEEVGLAGEYGNHVRRERAEFEIGAALAEFEGANDGVGNDAKDEFVELGSAAETAGIAFKDYGVVLGLADETEGAAADGMPGEIGGSIGGNDAHGGTLEVPEEGSGGFVEMEDDGLRIGGFDRVDHAEGAAFGGTVGGVAHEVDGGFDVGGGDGAAIVEEDAFAEMEDVGERSGRVPGFGQVGVEIHFGIALDEAVEKKSRKALGLHVGPEAGVKVGGIGFDDENQGGGIRWWVGAGGEEENGEEKRDGNTEFTEIGTQRAQRRGREISRFADSARNDGRGGLGGIDGGPRPRNAWTAAREIVAPGARELA